MAEKKQIDVSAEEISSVAGGSNFGTVSASEILTVTSLLNETYSALVGLASEVVDRVVTNAKK